MYLIPLNEHCIVCDMNESYVENMSNEERDRWYKRCAEVGPRVAYVLEMLDAKKMTIHSAVLKKMLNHELVDRARELHKNGMSPTEAITRATKDIREQQRIDFIALCAQPFGEQG